MMENRFNRQEIIEGWDQSILDSSRVAIVGSGNLVKYAAISLTSLGIGNIEIYNRIRSNGKSLFEDTKASNLEKSLKKLNKNARINGIDIDLSKLDLISLTGSPDVLLCLDNYYEFKHAEYGFEQDIPVIFGFANNLSADFLHLKQDMPSPASVDCENYIDKKQGNIPSMIMGGFIAEEVRKIIMPLNKEEKASKKFQYNFVSENKFASDYQNSDLKSDLKNKKALIVGAGALSNFFSYGLALEGVGKIDIMDFDEVEDTNLNRQFLFYDSVDKKKATELSKKLKILNPAIDVNPIESRLDENTTYFYDNKPDILVDCVDSLASRAFINYFGVRNDISIVSGGTNSKSGQVVTYYPGNSSCLDCKLDVETALAEERAAASCRFAPDPSVVTTNQIIAGMMLGEAVNLLNERGITKKMIVYDSTYETRGGIVGTSEICECTKPDMNEWLQDVDRKREHSKS